MILVFSNREDHSTNEVVKWFTHYDLPFMRINDMSEIYPQKDSSFGNFDDYVTYLKKNVSCVWFRRTPSVEINSGVKDKNLETTISLSLQKELIVLYYVIVDALKDKFWLNHPSTSSMNKLIVLKKLKNWD